MKKYNHKIKILKPLKGIISQNNTIKFNKHLLHLKIKELFINYDINGKFKLLNKNYNQEIINKIYEENIKELIDIMEMTYLEVFYIFRDSKENQKLNGLEKIDTVIKEIELKEKNDEYINKFKDVVMGFEKYYFNKVERNKKYN